MCCVNVNEIKDAKADFAFCHSYITHTYGHFSSEFSQELLDLGL